MKSILASTTVLFIAVISISAATASTQVFMTQNAQGSWDRHDITIADGSSREVMYLCDKAAPGASPICHQMSGESANAEMPAPPVPAPAAAPAPVVVVHDEPDWLCCVYSRPFIGFGWGGGYHRSGGGYHGSGHGRRGW